MSEFFNMGGFAVYVWSAYGISAVALIVLAMRSHQREKKTAEEAANLRRALRGQN